MRLASKRMEAAERSAAGGRFCRRSRWACPTITVIGVRNSWETEFAKARSRCQASAKRS